MRTLGREPQLTARDRSLRLGLRSCYFNTRHRWHTHPDTGGAIGRARIGRVRFVVICRSDWEPQARSITAGSIICRVRTAQPPRFLVSHMKPRRMRASLRGQFQNLLKALLPSGCWHLALPDCIACVSGTPETTRSRPFRLQRIFGHAIVSEGQWRSLRR